ncbi:MAG: type II toxin-antitoxin system RelE/ParE family toxin [Taibaiella sp.]|nr:type II toxin-antitoxin system RelE/ParE family toxin [Taibaiella sp.]
MNWKVVTTQNFKKELKRLSKKHPSLLDDILFLIERLESAPLQGVSLGNHFHKIRVSVTSKGQGKSGGARVITYIKVVDSVVYLVSIYDKSEKPTITPNELKEILKIMP